MSVAPLMFWPIIRFVRYDVSCLSSGVFVSTGGETVAEESDASLNITSIDMFSMGGFALFFGWMLVVFFWLFCDFPPGVPIAMRDVTQLTVFVGTPAAYLLVHFLAKNPKFNVFSTQVKVAETVCAIALPVLALAMYNGVFAPLWAVHVMGVLAGGAAACIQLSWLDVCSRLRIEHHSRFTGLSLFAGALLFVLVAFTPEFMQPLFAMAFVVLSILALTFATKRVPGNDERAPLESFSDTWRFTKEIEPSFFMFNVVFGMTFVFLFNDGRDPVVLGLISTLVGSLAVSILSMADKQLSITAYQRALVVVTVVACIVVPFVQEAGQVACSCVVTAAWAMFVAINYGYIVKKCVVAREAPLFRQAPIRLMVPALGFAVGWGVAAMCTVLFGAHAEEFMYVRLGVAVLLVLTVMVFLPSQEHHPADGLSPDAPKAGKTVVTVNTTESDLFEARCAAVAKLYQLSPRETEIIALLAKGRNAAYIQEALVISPHTVKSHIYNIYRKLDIHSQQKLMDFVEDFPLE